MNSPRKGGTIHVLLLAVLFFCLLILLCVFQSSLGGGQHPFVRVQQNDRIFDPMDTLGLSPIVVESHKLIFFPVSRVGATTWMKLFRRMMAYDDWKDMNPHEGDGGLVRLKDLDQFEATKIMNSPEYKRVIFIRDPKERFLSTWFQKVLQYDSSIQDNCCIDNENCLDDAQTLAGFIMLANNCVDRHWLPQSHVMESKYWPLLDFVGHAETMAEDAKVLLEQLDAWDDYGKSGWGKNGDECIFQAKTDGMNVKESLPSGSWVLAVEMYTQETAAAVDRFYADDYTAKNFNLPLKSLDFDKKQSSDTVVVKHNDRIYDPLDTLGLSPIVVKRHKLVFFQVARVGLTTWLRLFRRMEGQQDWKHVNPHIGDGDLVRLKNLDLDQATEVMNSPEYTRVIFVRDPKERFLSTWFEKIQHYDVSVTLNCCKGNKNCLDNAQNISGFVELASQCVDRHWLPQSQAMETQYWPKLDFVGHAESMREDAKRLLIQLGAWEDFGRTGWGKKGEEPIFLDDHLTNRRTSEYWNRFSEVLTPTAENAVDELFKADYNIPELNLHVMKVDFSNEGYEWKNKLRQEIKEKAIDQEMGIHILAYETNSSAIEERFSTWNAFLEMSKTAGIQTTAFGQGTDYHGFGDKYIHARKLLTTMAEDVIVVLADARDVLLNVPSREYSQYAIDNFRSTFRKLTRNNLDSVVISAEAQCCVSAMSHAGPEEYFDPVGNRNVRACSSGKDDCMYVGNINIHRWKSHMKELAFEMTGRHPESAYLNAGLIAGTPRALIGLIDRLNIEGYEDDQAVMSGLLFHDPNTHVLDYDQELFGNTEWSKGLQGGGCTFHVNQDGLLAHNATAKTPLIVHTPGKFFSCLDLLLDTIGGTSPKRYLKAANNDEGDAADEERYLQDNYGLSETEAPTINTEEVSDPPSAVPSFSVAPSTAPSISMAPSAEPSISVAPSSPPSISVAPSGSPTGEASAMPSMTASAAPSELPSPNPSAAPSVLASAMPSVNPSAAPSAVASAMPSISPTPEPSLNPSVAPSPAPTSSPSWEPSGFPSTVAPTDFPTIATELVICPPGYEVNPDYDFKVARNTGGPKCIPIFQS